MLTLVLGGTRSGKSRYAERLAAGAAERWQTTVRYVATAQVDPGDESHQARVAAHRARRPASWVDVECGSPNDLAPLLATHEVALVDSMGSWLLRHQDFAANLAALDRALREREAPTVLVSEEVGWSVHPPTRVGRHYVDALGHLNQHLA
ncbi:MAG: bifunctional adenosylcobinamide kinase/adenosylcobinamide-phosphate guanylyltransferase, partial [Ornithinimicrobium sp.]